MRDRVIVSSVQAPSEQRRRPQQRPLVGGSVAGAFEEHTQAAGAQAGAQNALEKEWDMAAQGRQ